MAFASDIVTELRKTAEQAGKALLDSKPVHAAAGAGDLWVEKVRAATESAQGLLSGARLDADELAAQLQARASAVADGVQINLAHLPARAQSAIVDATTVATAAYEDLADRGSSVIARIRRQQSTQDVKAAADTTASKAKATATAARKAASATTKQVRTTATTAKKTSAAARSQAKATTTAAKKTATAASKATKTAARKIG